jgi:hypothetical protein
LKKIAFLILLGFLTGCSTTALSNIPQEYAFNPKKNSSLILGKISFEHIEKGFGETILVMVDEAQEKTYPFRLSENTVTSPDDPKKTKTEYYFFLEIPPGAYTVYSVEATHKSFELLETHLLNANVTVPANTIMYIGTIQVKGLSRTMRMIGPVTEAEIIDEHADVLKVFKERYPQFKDREVKIKVIDRYELFKEDGIGGQF